MTLDFLQQMRSLCLLYGKSSLDGYLDTYFTNCSVHSDRYLQINARFTPRNLLKAKIISSSDDLSFIWENLNILLIGSQPDRVQKIIGLLNRLETCNKVSKEVLLNVFKFQFNLMNKSKLKHSFRDASYFEIKNTEFTFELEPLPSIADSSFDNDVTLVEMTGTFDNYQSMNRRSAFGALSHWDNSAVKTSSVQFRLPLLSSNKNHVVNHPSSISYHKPVRQTSPTPEKLVFEPNHSNNPLFRVSLNAVKPSQIHHRLQLDDLKTVDIYGYPLQTHTTGSILCKILRRNLKNVCLGLSSELIFDNLKFGHQSKLAAFFQYGEIRWDLKKCLDNDTSWWGDNDSSCSNIDLVLKCALNEQLRNVDAQLMTLFEDDSIGIFKLCMKIKSMIKKLKIFRSILHRTFNNGNVLDYLFDLIKVMEQQGNEIEIKISLLSLFQITVTEYLGSLDDWNNVESFPFSLYKDSTNNTMIGDTFWKHGWQFSESNIPNFIDRDVARNFFLSTKIYQLIVPTKGVDVFANFRSIPKNLESLELFEVEFQGLMKQLFQHNTSLIDGLISDLAIDNQAILNALQNNNQKILDRQQELEDAKANSLKALYEAKMETRVYMNDQPERIAKEDYLIPSSDPMLAVLEEKIKGDVLLKYDRQNDALSHKAVRIRWRSARFDADLVKNRIHFANTGNILTENIDDDIEESSFTSAAQYWNEEGASIKSVDSFHSEHQDIDTINEDLTSINIHKEDEIIKTEEFDVACQPFSDSAPIYAEITNEIELDSKLESDTDQQLRNTLISASTLQQVVENDQTNIQDSLKWLLSFPDPLPIKFSATNITKPMHFSSHIFSDILNSCMQSYSSVLDTASLQIYLLRSSLSNNIRLLEDFFLLRNGKFAKTIKESLFEGYGDIMLDIHERGLGGLGMNGRSSWPPSVLELSGVLTGIIEESLSDKILKKSVFFGCSNNTNLNVNDINASQFITLCYNPPSLANLVVSPISILKYQEIFNHLIKLLRAEEALNRVFYINDYTMSSSDSRVFRILKRELRVFLTGLMTFSNLIGISESFDRFKGVLMEVLNCKKSTVRTVKDLYDIHMRMLDDIQFKLFIGPSQKEIATILDSILQVILTFSRLSCKLTLPVIDLHQKQPDYDDLHAEWNDKYLLLMRVIQGQVDKLGRLDAHGVSQVNDQNSVKVLEWLLFYTKIY